MTALWLALTALAVAVGCVACWAERRTARRADQRADWSPTELAALRGEVNGRG